MSQEIKQQILALQNDGKTVMVLGTDKDILAFIAVADEVRDTSKEVIQKLHEIGIKNSYVDRRQQRDCTSNR